MPRCTKKLLVCINRTQGGAARGGGGGRGVGAAAAAVLHQGL